MTTALDAFDEEPTEQWQRTIVGAPLVPRSPARALEVDHVVIELEIEEGPDPAMFGAESCVPFPVIINS